MTTDSNAASIAKLRFAFQQICTRTGAFTPNELESLRTRVCQVVRDLRDRGTLPNRITAIVGEIAREAGVTLAGNASLAVVVKWCVDEYCAEPVAMKDG